MKYGMREIMFILCLIKNHLISPVKTDALLLLDKAKIKGVTEVVEEITDMLMDLELSISENKCNCHKGDSCG